MSIELGLSVSQKFLDGLVVTLFDKFFKFFSRCAEASSSHQVCHQLQFVRAHRLPTEFRRDVSVWLQYNNIGLLGRVLASASSICKAWASTLQSLIAFFVRARFAIVWIFGQRVFVDIHAPSWFVIDFQISVADE